MANTQEVWDEHWIRLNLKKDFLGKIFNFFRINFIVNEVSWALDNYFPEIGFFLDCGSGTSQTAKKIKPHKRKLVAVDFSYKILEYARKEPVVNYFVNSDILKLPFKDNSIAGIWNLGVMEHFEVGGLKKVFEEFYRVMRPGAYCILFWPAVFGPTNLLFSTIEMVLKAFSIKRRFFPEEPSLLRSKKWIKEIIRTNTRFQVIEIKWALRSALIYHRVVLKK